MKNKEYYKKYKEAPHQPSRRGLTYDQAAVKKAHKKDKDML